MYKILFSHEKEGNSTIWDNMDGSYGLILNEINQEKISSVWSHLYVESKNIKLKNSGSRMAVTRGWGVGGKCGNVGQEVQTFSYKMSELNLVHGMVTTVKSVLCTGTLFWEQSFNVLTMRTVTKWLLYEVQDVLSNLPVANILQYSHV